MNDSESLPTWRLPPGVNPSLWRYAHTPRLATEEDEYFAGHPLFRADAEALASRFVDPAPLVDLGSGAGRHSLAFALRGFPVVAVDLSAAMLGQVATKALRAGVEVATVQANLCRLGCFPDSTFAYALSMFSTLGMIRGRLARQAALAEAFRILRPGGRLALHAHNAWLDLRDSQGRAWLRSVACRKILRRPGGPDKQMTYRGVAGMEVHLFTWKELSADLQTAGFRLEESLPIDAVHARPIGMPWLLPKLRAGGWILFLTKPQVKA